MYKIIIALLLTSFSVCAQSATEKKEFKNQGEQENYWAQQLFEKYYLKEKYKRYDSKIEINGNSYKYNDKTLDLRNTAHELTTIFSKGIVFPSLVEIEFILSQRIRSLFLVLKKQLF